jgi:hypothetical protein
MSPPPSLIRPLLARESLIVKIKRLLAKCRPPSRWSPMEGNKCDLGRIRHFDEQRHLIIHGKALGKPLALFQVSEENIYKMQDSECTLCS